MIRSRMSSGMGPAGFLGGETAEGENSELRRDRAAAQGELGQLIADAGGKIERMILPEDHRRPTDVEPPGALHWDTSQLPQAIGWIVAFVSGGGALAFLGKEKTRERIARLITLGNLRNGLELKVPGLAVKVTGSEADFDKAVAKIKELAADPNVQALAAKLPGKARKAPAAKKVKKKTKKG